MSGVFDLDRTGATALDMQARQNPLDPAAMPPQLWEGTGQQFGMLLRSSATAGRTLMMAGAPAVMGLEELGSDPARPVRGALGTVVGPAAGTALDLAARVAHQAREAGEPLTDTYFEHVVEGLGQDAVDYWTPDAATSGAAAQTLGTVFQVVGAIPQIIGLPGLFLADSGFSPATDVIREGGSTEAALGVGAVNLGVNAVGMRLPAAFGNTLMQRVATGTGANLALGAAANVGSQQILLADGQEELAAGYDPLNPQAWLMDTLMGAVFAGKAHLDARPALTPTQRNALLTANSADHFANGTLPGQPRTPDAAVAHQDALAVAIEQVLRGERVDVSSVIDLGQFDLRPDLAAAMRQSSAGTPAIENYDAFRHALESGGRADAAAATSSALGIDQFTAGTWRRTVAIARPAWAEGLSDAELLAARRDPAKSAEMEQVLRAENAAALEAAGQEVNALTLYAAHHFGADRGVAFARASGDTPMAEILTAGQMKANPYLDGLTKDQAIANWRDRARRAGVMLADELDAPNFGLPEAPRTIADDDPFWQSIPEGPAGQRETANIDTPERQAMREQWVDEHFADVQRRILGEGERPVAYVMGGGGASGKGTILRDLLETGTVPREGVVHIDPDEIKTGSRGRGLSGIPEYQAIRNRGDSRAAAVVHEESSQVAQRVRERAVAEKYDIVLDRTLGDPEKAMRELQALKDAGYEVRLYGVTLDPGEAVRRAVKRAEGKGRYVPLDRLLEAHRGFASGFEGYASLTDQAFLFDNSGAAPILIADAVGGASPQIRNETAYNSFRGRSETNAQATTHRELQSAARESAGQHDARALAAGEGRPGLAGARERSHERLEAGDRGTGAPQGESRLDPDAPRAAGDDTTAVSEFRAAQEAVEAMPGLQVMDENGVARPAREYLDTIEADAAQAEETVRGIHAAANCFMRTAA